MDSSSTSSDEPMNNNNANRNAGTTSDSSNEKPVNPNVISSDTDSDIDGDYAPTLGEKNGGNSLLVTISNRDVRNRW